jgi:hypothetical protein
MQKFILKIEHYKLLFLVYIMLVNTIDSLLKNHLSKQIKI